MGVDYSSSMVNIRDFHAYDIKNFIKKNNVLRNRNGYEQVGKLKINGMWECNYNGSKIIIAHIGKKLYRITDIDEFRPFNDTNYHEIKDINETLIEDKPSWGVFANDRLYILCGNYCVLKFPNEANNYNWSFSKVSDDEDTYVPTTTIGITFSGNKTNISRVNLDNANILSSYRYNTLSTNVAEGEEAYYNNYSTKHPRTYVLDADIEEVTMFKLNYVDANGSVIELSARIQEAEGYLTLNVPAIDLGLVEQVGLVTIGKVLGNGTLILDYDFMQPNELEDNVTIKFKPTYASETYLIDKCTFGVVYGANGNRNRLFLSGNPSKPNVDYHSSRRNVYATDTDIDLEDSQDFTYFSVYDYCAYGTSNSAITDYQIMGNGDLMVLKEHNVNEPCIYFRTGSFDTNEQGYTIETYPTRVGNIGKGTLPNHKGTLKNLNNDLVFASPLGVFGISSTISAGTLNSDYQYAYSRSRLINSKLNAEFAALEAITATIYDSKYICTIKDKNGVYKTFVADGRYPYKLEENIDNEYEYEWFVLDNINADRYFEINNSLYFTNKDGLFKFDILKEATEHFDITKYDIKNGDIVSTSNEIAVNNFYEYIDNTSVLTVLNTFNIFITENISVNSGVVHVNSKLVRDYFEDKTNHIFVKEGENLVEVFPFEVEDEYNIYELKYINDPNAENAHLTYDSIPIMFKVNGKNFTFTEDKTKFVDTYGNEVVFVDNNIYENTNVLGIITNTKPVECLYVTKAFNMGQSLYNKNLKSITVVNDAESYSWVNFAIRTKKVKKRFTENIVGGTEGIADTYENIFKADLTDGTFATSFTKNYYLKFNFVQFEFFNNNGSDCIINNINVVYTTGFKQGGIS